MRVEGLREEFGPGSPLLLAAIAAYYLDVIATFMHTEKAARGCAALSISRGHLQRIVQRICGLERRAIRRHRSQQTFRPERTHKSTLRTYISTVRTVIL